MKKPILLLLICCGFSCEMITGNQPAITHHPQSEEVIKQKADSVLDNWHKAAAAANFESYFDYMTKDAVFIGTDATENWQNDEFREFSKPYFDKGKAWDFTTLERNIYPSPTGETAWFDELLSTQMGLCRGSGVLVNSNEGWKIKHYVLSVAIPNGSIPEITAIKKEFDSTLTSKLQQND